MKRGTFTNFFAKSLSLIIIGVLISWTSYGQTFNPIPDVCYGSPSIDLNDYVVPSSTHPFTMDPAGPAAVYGSLSGPNNNIYTPPVAAGGVTITFTYHQGSDPTQTLQINDAPTIPTNITSTPDKYCEDYADGAATITLSASGGNGTTYNWYDVSSNFLGSGNSIVQIAQSVPTLYQVTYENACGESLPLNYTVIPVAISQSDLDITGLDAIYCNDAADDNVTGVPNSLLGLSTVFSPIIPGIADNGGGSATISPTTLGTGNYNLTYTVSKDNCLLTITEPFSVAPPLVVSFTPILPAEVCADALYNLVGSPIPNPPTSTGTFSGPGVTNNGDGTGIFDPSGLSGSVDITYTYIDGNSCNSTSTQTVIVDPLPSVSILDLEDHYCDNDATKVITGDPQIGNFTITPVTAAFTDNRNGTANFDPSAAGVGTYQIEYEYTDGNSCTNTAYGTTEVHPILVPTISGNDNPCQNVEITYTTEAAMDNYNWVVSAGGTITAGGTPTDNTVTVNWDNSGAQTVQITYDDPNGGCTSHTPTKNITVKPEPTVTLDPFPAVCLADAAFTLTGGNGSPAGGTGIYSGLGVSGGNFDPGSAGAGTHTITYTYTAANACSNSDSEDIDVLDLSVAISSLSANYCYLHSDENIIGNNTDGGIGAFNIAPVPANGAMFTNNGNNTATFSPNNCDPSDYYTVFTITYTYTNGTCSATDFTTSFVYGSPVVTINGLAGDYCTSDPIDAFTGTPPNGTFSTTAPAGLTYDGAGNGTFDPAAAGAAGSPYTISYYYVDLSGCDNTAVKTVNVNQTPDPVITSSDADNTICEGTSVIFSATDNEGVADTWEFLIDGASVQGPGASNTFTTSSLNNGEVVRVIASVGASCSATSTGITTTVVNAPTPTFVSGDASVCAGDAELVYETQSGMNNYVWAVVGGTITAGGTATDPTATVTWNTAGNQSISVNYENANSCSAASATVLNVTVTALPNNTLAVSDDEICEGDIGLITLSGSQAGVTYQLRYDANDAPVGPAYNGTGGDINFADNPVATTTYNIIASNANGCVNELLDKPVITVNPLPIPGLVCSDADLTICQGESVSFTASGGDTYEFFVDGVSVQGPSATNVFTTASLDDGEAVSVEVTWAATLCYDQSADITLNVLPLPTISLTGDQEVCLNETGVVYSTDAGMTNYTWSVVGGSVDAGGGANDHTVTVSWTSLGAQSVSVNYEDGNTCQAATDEILAVNVNGLPDGSFDLGNPIICLNDVATIEQSGSEIGVDYQLRLNSDDSEVGSAVSGTGSPISFDLSPATTTSYNVLATSAANCTTELSDLSTVIVNALPNDALGILGSTVCFGDAGTITLQASELGVSYQLRLNNDDSNVGVPLVGTGGDLTFNVAPTLTTTYNILATNGNSCSVEMATLPLVTVNPLPDITLVVSDDEICMGETASIVLFNSIPGVEYQLRLNSDDSDVGTSQTGNGSDLLFTVSPITSTTYNILATDANACSAEITDLAVVQVSPLPNNTINISSPSICVGENAVITLESSVPGVTYQLRLDSDNSNVGAAVPGNGSDITFSVSPASTTVYNVLATSSVGCSDELINKSTVTVFDAPADNLVVDDDEICFGESASVVLYNSEIRVTYQLRLDSDNSNVGIEISGTGGNIVFNVAPVSTTLYKVYAYNSNACASEILDKPTVTVNPLPNNTLTLGDDAICNGETADIVLYNSILGVNYQLRLDSDNSNIGSSQSGNGGSLTFHDSPTSTTTYNILAIDPNGCSNELTDKSIVQVYPLAIDNLTVSDPTICYGENAVISVSNSETGVSYQLRLDSDNSNVGAAVPGNNGTITFNVAPLSTTLFNVLATTSNSCNIELLDRALVTVNPTPDETLAVSSPTICNGETAEIVVYTSEVGVSYQLRLDSDNTTVGVPVAGNGGNISFFVNPITSTTYNILALGGNTCNVELNNKSNVTVYPLPDPTLLTDDATICNGETASIVLINSENGVNYQLRLDSDDSPLGAVQVGTGGNLVFNVSPIISTVYNIYATTSNACSQELYDKPVVTVLPSPNLNLALSDDEICFGETATIVLSNSELGVNYQLRKNIDNSLVGSPISGTGFDLEFYVNPLASEVYNILATNSNACSGTLVDLSSVTVHSLPPKPVITASGPTTFCNGGSVDLSSSVADAYLWNNGETTQTITVDISGTYSLTVTDANACISPQSNPISVTVLPLPVVDIINLDPEYCHDAAAVIITGDPLPGGTTSASFIGPGITDNGDGTAIFDPIAAGIGGPYNIEYAYTNANSCTNSIIQTTIVNEAPSISFSGLDTEYCVDHGIITITGSEAPEGNFSGSGIINNGNGTAYFDPGAVGIGGPYTISYNYTNPFGCSNSYSEQTTINPLPIVTFGTLNSEYCVDNAVVTLTGNHAPEGSFSGIGVFDNGNGTATFDPAAAGVGGPYQISYTYSDGNLCVNTSTQETEVFPLPTVNFSGLQTDYCVNDISSILIGNHAPYGVFTGLGITDHGNGTATFDPTLAGVGQNIVIHYSYTSDQFCINSKSRTTNVHGLPIVDIDNLDLNYCLNEPDIEIIGNPLPDGNSNAYFTGEGITDHGDGTATFSPSSLEADQNYTITYTFMDINSCENSESYEVNIIDLPNPPQTQDVMVCFGENVPALTAVGEPGFQIIWYNEAGDSIHSGNTYQTGLTDPGEYLFSVTQIHTITQCESNESSVSLTINELPDVNLPAFEDVCIYDFIIYLNTGTPAGGEYSGSQGILQMPNGDYIFHPEYAGVGVHDIIYTYTNPNTNCQDTAYKTITVHDRPEVGIVDLGDVYCVSGTEVTIHGNYPGFGSFSGPGIVDNGDGSAQFFPNIAGLGNHEITYEYQDINTSCSNEISQITKVEGIPENVSFINISNPEICADENGNITLEAIGGDGTWVNWFKGSCNGTSPEILTSNPDSSIIVIPPPSVSTYYYAQWETECGVSEICAEDYILVTQIPTKPDTTWVTPNVICNNDQDSVALYIIGGNYGTILQWTQDSCTGTIVGQTSGEPLLIPTPDTTTKYFARWMNDCGESQCTEAIRVWVTAPVEEVAVAEADSNYFCVNTLDQVELRAFGGVGDTIIWYYDTLGYNPVPMDSIISINQPRGDTIQIVPPHMNTSFYPFRASVCEQVGGNVGVDLFVYNAPVEVDTAYVFPASVCFGTADSITLIAQGGSGETLEWYAGDCEDGMFIGNGNHYKIPAPLVTTQYYARWTTPCGLSDCFETQVEIYPPTTDPVAIASDTNIICAGNLDEIQLVLIGGSGDSVIWFSDSCGGTPLNGSAFYYQSPKSDTIVIPAPSSDTTFYAYWATACEVSECVSIDITVYPQPIVMDTVYSNYNNFCSGSLSNITLTALGGFGDEISWTRGSCDGPIVAISSGPSVTIPAPMDTTTYFAKWKTLCDSTECKSIQINVPPSPQNPTQIHILENLICDNVVDSITLVLEGGSGYKAIWFYGANCGNDTIPEESIHYLSDVGDTIRIARPAQSLYITANWTSYNNNCGSSECVSKEVFIYEAPTAYFEMSGGEPCENTLLQFDPQSDPGSGLITNLHWNFGDGTIIDTNLQVYQYHQYSQSGIYNVDLIITNTYGCQDTANLPLEISEGPQALFTYNSSCLGDPVQFNDQSLAANGEIESWFWDFGDASSNNDTSTLQFPTYIYQQPGIYTVTLVVSETGGCQNEIQQPVYVAPNPTAYFQLGTASCQSVPVFFNDSSYTNYNAIGTWIWNFGDGSADSVIYAPQSPDVWYTYYTNGDFTVSLTVIDTSGCESETFYQYFEVRPQPIAGFTFSDTACQTGIIHFYDTTYHEPGTTGEAWSWSFGDGSFAYNQNPVHSYIETGEFYNVQMIITDEYGCQDTVANDIEVQPELEISFSSNLVCEGQPTEFIAHIDQPIGGSVVEWQWFFGDNTDTIVMQDTINHTFPAGGTFYTTLIGVDEGGCETIVINQAVHVNPAPIVDFFIPEASCNDPSIFYDHSVANAEIITNYHFDYGDGTYENFTNENYNDPIQHPYPAGANQYIATISLTNSNTCEATQEFPVLRESCITISFNPQYPACVNQDMMFVNTSYINNNEVTIDSIIWNFGDGVIYEFPIEEGDTVYHAYQTTGLKEVKMTLLATNQFGDFTTQTVQYIYVNELPNAEFTVDQNLLCSRDSIQFRDQSWVFNGDIVGWKWDFGDLMEDNDTSYQKNPRYWYAYSGDYTPTLTAISDSGCMNAYQKPINLNPSPINHLFANVEYGCGPQNEILFRDTAYMESGNVNYHQWIFGFNDTVYTEEDSLWHQLNIGEYKVISRVVSEIGCEGIDSLTGFNVFDEPIARFSYYPDDPSIREPEVFFNDQSIGPDAQVLYYHWNFGDNSDTVGLDPVHIYQDTGLFNVVLTIQDENGCVDSVTNTLYVDPVFSFYIPNAFSPNGNGLNDEFGPIGSYFDDTYYEFQIYNRWGELLFETKDPHRYWQGDYSLTTKNQVPLGVYSWIIRVEDAMGDEHVYKGMVTVVR